MHDHHDHHDQYLDLLDLLRHGGKIDSMTLDRILANAGKKAANLVHDLHVTRVAGPVPGAPCPSCGEPLVVTSSKTMGTRQRQYVGCRHCGHRAGHRLVPSGLIRRRRQRRS